MKKYYVVQVFAGYEENAKKDLERRIAQMGKQDLFGEILVPVARAHSPFSAGDEIEEQLFPGYVIVEMEMIPEAMRLVLEIPRINRFLGGKEPLSLSASEVKKLSEQMSGQVIISGDAHEFEVGREVEIVAGPFIGFLGVVSDIDEPSQKLTIMVSILGRMTPVELSFDQVKK